MILVNLNKNGTRFSEQHPLGAYAVPTDDGLWLYIYDEDGLTLACYPKDVIEGVRMTKEAGETTAISENPK